MKLKKESSPVDLIKKAQASLEAGDKEAARQFAHSATQNTLKSEQAWLILASLSEPEQALIYLENALRANPKSRAARKGIRLVFNQMMEEEKKKKDQAPGRDALNDTAPIPVIIEQEKDQIEIEPSLLEKTEDFIDNQTWKPESIEINIGEEEESEKKLDDTSPIPVVVDEEVTDTTNQAKIMELPEAAEVLEKEPVQPESIEIEQPAAERESEKSSTETPASEISGPTRKEHVHQRLAKKEAVLPKISKKVVLRRKTAEQVEPEFSHEKVEEELSGEETGILEIDKVEIPEKIEEEIAEIRETVEEQQPSPVQENLQETISPIASEEIELDNIFPEKEPVEASQEISESSPQKKSHKELHLKHSLKKEISSQPEKKLLKEKQKSATGKREMKVHNGTPNVDLIELILISGVAILLPLLVFLYFYLSNK